MSLTALMIEQIGAARTIVEDGAEVVPVWRINTPEGTYLVFTRFDHDKPEQRERLLHLMARFMVWKMATSFVLTAETWLGAKETREGDEALLVIGVSHHERLGRTLRIETRDLHRFGAACGYGFPVHQFGAGVRASGRICQLRKGLR